jgi:two-component system, cell cycle sensor histidine kinase and response regulator CckA
MTDRNVGAKEHSGATILVVEDSDAIRRVVCAMLSQNGYTCLEASDGTEALSVLRSAERVELVLTDIVMPKMSGAELAGHLTHDYPALPIVFMSGYTDNPFVRAIEQTPLFLAKPFTSSALTSSVRQALEMPWAGLPPWYLKSSSS